MSPQEFLEHIVLRLQELSLTYCDNPEGTEWAQLGIDTGRALCEASADELANRLAAELRARGASTTFGLLLLRNANGKEWTSQGVLQMGGVCVRLCVGEFVRTDIKYA